MTTFRFIITLACLMDWFWSSFPACFVFCFWVSSSGTHAAVCQALHWLRNFTMVVTCSCGLHGLLSKWTYTLLYIGVCITFYHIKLHCTLYCGWHSFLWLSALHPFCWYQGLLTCHFTGAFDCCEHFYHYRCHCFAVYTLNVLLFMSFVLLLITSKICFNS